MMRGKGLSSFFSPQVVPSLTFQNTLVRPLFKYFQLNGEIEKHLDKNAKPTIYQKCLSKVKEPQILVRSGNATFLDLLFSHLKSECDVKQQNHRRVFSDAQASLELTLVSPLHWSIRWSIR